MPAEIDAPAFSPRGSLTAEPDRFSEVAWELLLASQEQARRWRHDQLDVEHLLQVLFTDPRHASWVDPLPIDRNRLLDQLDDFCADQPSSGARQLFIGEALEELLESADRQRAGWGSRLIDAPHLLLALREEPRIGAALLQRQGLTAELLQRALREGPGPLGDEPVSTAPQSAAPSGSAADAWIDDRSRAPASAAQRPPVPAAEVAPEVAADGLRLEREPTALEQFGRDLTAAARAGELDPVIGRDTEIRRLIQVLSRRSKNNPVLIGEPGVG